MSNGNKQQKIIQEQTQANERMIRAVEQGDAPGVFRGQAPVNERIKQIPPNERIDTPQVQNPAPPPPDKGDAK